ncbi:FAD dependent oxidoreductase [Dacryopinax primogenitus]|uniref:FAD dependent oxidoreductase n=1 Tax=Dacryopinax primogenitus (strain DJM 731) TaxID=1858805 RepID=M5G6K2_DACPD|nr:FAD dependent oxidoreductase [Dacryopinax primogenitus]EJU03835.1 FAD dependent oxidoreductase [Dacryopinax primogenitus]
MSSEPIKVFIIGAGAFGLSTALHLLTTPRRYNVTILERHPSGLPPDSASYDLNKIVRSDYPDLAYARLAREAVSLWKEEAWDGVYHETGVLVLGDHSPTGQYTSSSLTNSLALGCRIIPATDVGLQAYFPPIVPIPMFERDSAYLNRDGGWVEAERTMGVLRAQVEGLGALLLGGRTVTGLTKDDRGEMDAVLLSSGEDMHADLVVVATGAWTPSLFPHLGLQEKLLATGQSELFLRLSEEERSRWKGNPVLLDWNTGMSVFEPTEDGTVKIAIHHAGYVYRKQQIVEGKEYVVSTPLTSEEGSIRRPAVPGEVVTRLRDWLKQRYPGTLGDNPFVGSRMCWYTDTPDGDWLVDFHPEHPKLLFVTGGSGHAFKFLPNLGSLVRQRIERSLPQEWAGKVAWKEGREGRDVSRVGERTELLDLGGLVELGGC